MAHLILAQVLNFPFNIVTTRTTNSAELVRELKYAKLLDPCEALRHIIFRSPKARGIGDT